MDIDKNHLYESLSHVSAGQVVTFLSSGAMIFGGVIPYIPQYRTIRRTKNSDGFSNFVCFVLLLANILRVFFWFGKHFELPLLVQSILMIIAMLVMVEICVRVRHQTEIIQTRQHSFRGSPPVYEFAKRTFYQSFLDMDWSHFWKWTDFLSYIEFLLVVTAVLSLTTYLFIDNELYVETIGFLAVFTEAMLGTPQLYRNFTKQSTEGMSVSMVLMWLSGDVFKTVYFIARSAPAQFWLCGILQITVDIAILLQVLYYTMYPPQSHSLSSRHAR